MPGSLRIRTSRGRRCTGPRLAAILVGLGCCMGGAVSAQIAVPGVGSTTGVLPGVVGLPRDRIEAIGGGIGGGVGARAERALRQRAEPVASELRRRNIDTLLRQHPDRLEADPAGEPIRRAELLLVSPEAALLEAAYRQGYRLLREDVLDELGLRSVVLQPPDGAGTADALTRLRALDPRLEVDFNHVYLRGGSVDASTRGRPGSQQSAASIVPDTAARRIGLIDSGVDFAHPSLRASPHRLWGCGGRPVASPHGTAVASLLVGGDASHRGMLPGALLYAADVYCGSAPDGGSAEAVAKALAWMAGERVAVVNVSLVGPANRLLERAVQALHGRGHLVVAAVGNDGPAAPPLYPAAYPWVVGVTGTTAARQVLPEAAQGPHVAFAAPGAGIAVARSASEDHVVARGTSFAAPLVAGLLAELLPIPDPGRARDTLQQLARHAIDLGHPGRDSVYGHGLVDRAQRLQLAVRD